MRLISSVCALMMRAVSRCTAALAPCVGRPPRHHDRLCVVVDHPTHEVDVGLRVRIAQAVGAGPLDRGGLPHFVGGHRR